MKRLIKLVVLAVIVVLADSCEKASITRNESNGKRLYSLLFDSPTKTELDGTGDKRRVKWGNEDLIHYYTSSFQDNPLNASVRLEGNNAYIQIPGGRTDEFINAIYGADNLKSNISAAEYMCVSSPIRSEQSFTSFSDVHMCAVFSEDIENTSLFFQNIASILTFTSCAPIAKVVISGNNGEIINGGKYGDLIITAGASGELSVESAATGNDADSQSKVIITTDGSDSVYYIAILPVVFKCGLSVTCYDANDNQLAIKNTRNTVNTVSVSGLPKIIDLGMAQDWIDNPSDPLPDVVDLGLSVKWASCNVGATKPEDFGYYFAWGETTPKSEYRWSNYKYGQSKNGPFSKYVLNPSLGVVDYKTVLDQEDDAAIVRWGDNWRIPTTEEFNELLDPENCTWTWTTQNGVQGYVVSSNKQGFKNHSIFLPANGSFSGATISDTNTTGNYWSSSISKDGEYFALSPYFSASYVQSGNCYRYLGLGIRPVFDTVVPVVSISIPESVNLLVGGKDTLIAEILPENATHKSVTWSSSDESIATVDNKGQITAVSLGSTTIIAHSADGNIATSCVVNVNQLIQSISLDKDEIEIYVGDDPVALSATILPDEHTNKELLWTSSNDAIATVDAEGYVTAVAQGSVTITAFANDGSDASASCAATVYYHVDSVSLNQTKATLEKGQSVNLVATVYPATARNKTVSWSSSNSSIASVNEYGYVTAGKTGTATITVKTQDKELTASCVIDVIVHTPKAVDLGLSVLWADCNLGATKSSEFGDYYAWGEVSTKSYFRWNTYKLLLEDPGYFADDEDIRLSKYNTKSSYGPIDNITILDAEDDVAHALLGGKWRMPTKQEIDELLNNCDWAKTSVNGVIGRLARKKGSVNNPGIFIPSGSSYIIDKTLEGGDHDTYIWTSSLYTDNPLGATCLHFNHNTLTNVRETKNLYRYYGLVVRPVCSK